MVVFNFTCFTCTVSYVSETLTNGDLTDEEKQKILDNTQEAMNRTAVYIHMIKQRAYDLNQKVRTAG